ncbi:FixH family protein [uncultured Hydrogenophaga sp.]|uniref:FixH family protein n=1 Tax=uncultured Hydrogenophaga sp. TaxID=199683 RepID=UPI00265F6643|nr:FixH family protein [uncultured Hydrogenophaga sp.]
MNPSAPHPVAAEPWWRVKAMWLVVGGPLLVVVASMVTVVIAVMNPDPVLDKTAYERDLATARALNGPEREAALIKLQPAHQARNHAAAPVVPQDR